MRTSWVVLLAACSSSPDGVWLDTQTDFARGEDTGLVESGDDVLMLEAQCADPGFCGCDFDAYDYSAPTGPDTCIHQTATVDVDALISAGARIEAGAAVHRLASVGAGTVIGPGATLAARSQVGANSTIGANTLVGRAATVGSDTDIGADSSLGRSAWVGSNVDASSGDLTLGYAARIGDNTVVEGSNVVLGNYAEVGANSRIGAGVVMARGSVFGDDTVLGANVIIGPEVIGQQGITLGAGTRIRKRTTIGDDVTIGTSVRIGRDSDIRANAVIGDDAVLRSEVTIGTFATVEADAYLRRGTVYDDLIGGFSPDDAPVVVITSPSSGYDALGGGVTVSGTATDDNGISSLTLQIDGQTPVVVAVTNGTFSHTFSSLTDRAQTIRALAIDTVGNRAEDRIFLSDCNISTSTTHQWTGAVNSDWSTAGNWSAGTVPTTGNTVFVCSAVGNTPTLSENVTIGALYMDGMGVVNGGSHLLSISSRLDGGTVTGTGMVRMTGGYVRGTVSNLDIRGDVWAAGYIRANRDLTLASGTYRLRVGGYVVQVDGNFHQTHYTTNCGLYMINSLGELNVSGDVRFTGAAHMTPDTLAAGRIEVGGNFRADCLSGYDCFVSTGANVVFNGTAPQALYMAISGGADSRFGELTIRNPAGVTATSGSGPITVVDGLTVENGAVFNTAALTSSAAESPNRFRGGSVVNAMGTMTLTGDIAVDDVSTLNVNALVAGREFVMTPESVLTGNRVDLLSRLLTPSDNYSATTTRILGDIFVTDDWTHTMPQLELPSGTYRLRVGSHKMNLTGNYLQTHYTTNYGLYMTNGSGEFNVNGNMTFTGAAHMTIDTLSAGSMAVTGDFSANCISGYDCFVATGTKVSFTGTEPQTVSLAISGVADSRFATVAVTNPAGVTMSTNSGIVHAMGNLEVSSNGVLNLNSSFTAAGAGTNTFADTSVVNANNTLRLTGPSLVTDTAALNVDVMVTGATFAMDPTTSLTGNRVDMLTELLIPSDNYTAAVTRVLGDLTVRADWDHTMPRLDIPSGTYRLRVGQYEVHLYGNYTQTHYTTNYGLYMVHGSGLFDVTGDMTFGGAAHMTTDTLSAGRIRVGGDFNAACLSGYDCFVATGTSTEFYQRDVNPIAQSVTMVISGGADSRFADVIISNPLGVSLTAQAGVLYAMGNLTVSPNAVMTTPGMTVAGAGTNTIHPGATVTGTNTLTLSGPTNVLGDASLDVDVTVAGSYFNMSTGSSMTGDRFDMLTQFIIPSDDYTVANTRVLGLVTVQGDWDHKMPRLDIPSGTYRLVIGANDVRLDGNYTQTHYTTDYGLFMTNGSGVFDVVGDVTFGGAAAMATNTLSAGQMRVGGNFTANCLSGNDCFVATGTSVEFYQRASSPIAQTVSLIISGVADNRFADVIVNNPLGVTLTAQSGTFHAERNLTVSPNAVMSTTGFTAAGAGTNTIHDGASVSGTNTLTLTGPTVVLGDATLDVQTTVAGSTFTMSPQSSMSGDRFDMLTKLMVPSDDYTVALTRVLGDLTVSADWDHKMPHLQIPSGTYRLRVGGYDVQLEGDYSQVHYTTNYGLYMISAAGRFAVSGTTTFGGAAHMTTDALSAGVLELGGDLNVACLSGYDCFVATGTTTRFKRSTVPGAPTVQNVSFVITGAADSRFGTVDVEAGSEVQFDTNVYASGAITVDGLLRNSAGRTSTTNASLTVNSGGELTNSGTFRYNTTYTNTGTLTAGSNVPQVY